MSSKFAESVGIGFDLISIVLRVIYQLTFDSPDNFTGVGFSGKVQIVFQRNKEIEITFS